MKRLAIIGASYLQLPLVVKAKAMGIETHCFAWEEGAVCKDSADYFYPISIINKEKTFEVCKQIKIDGITSIASDAAVATISFVAEKLNLIANSYENSVVSTNKNEMRKKFQDHDISCPQFVIAEKNYSIEKLILPLIVKPTDRSGSRGVMKVECFEELNGAISRAKKESFSNQAIIEEYIEGVEVSVETISWEGAHYILAITDKITTGEPYFVELEHHQPTSLSIDIQKKIKSETVKALNALEVNCGASHTEFKITTGGDVYIIELGARMGGDFIGSDLVQLSTGYDFVKATIDVALGNFEKPKLTDSMYSGVYFLSKESEYLLPIIQNKMNDKSIIRAEITDSDLHSISCSADRDGYFIYQSNKKFIV